MEWIFGIDGGGTSARLRAESLDGLETFNLETSGMNPRSVGWEGTRLSLRFLFQAIKKDKRFPLESCAAGFAGVAGVGRTGDKEKLLFLIREETGLACPLKADTDALPALVGALGSREGILLIAGTGSIALGSRNSDDTLIRSGGWGHILGDEGSAYDVGRRGISAALRYRDRRGPPTMLLDSMLAHFGISDPFLMIPEVYENFDKAKIAGFAAQVGRARDSGDPAAAVIFKSVVQELVDLVASVAEQIGATEGERRISMTGGLVSNDKRLSKALKESLEARLPRYRIMEPREDAARGACILAREIAEFS
jgi:N-acetylglucosamine kinase-like BadF-type ATPase